MSNWFARESVRSVVFNIETIYLGVGLWGIESVNEVLVSCLTVTGILVFAVISWANGRKPTSSDSRFRVEGEA